MWGTKYPNRFVIGDCVINNKSSAINNRVNIIFANHKALCKID